METERLPSGVFFNLSQHVPRLHTFGVDTTVLPMRSHPSENYRFGRSETPFQTLSVDRQEIEKTDDEERDRRYLPLLEVSMDVNVVATTSRTVLTQTFSNFSNATVEEATYCFPLYDGSIVVGFRCWIGESKVLEGIVKPKETARAEFKEAISRQRAAVLLEEVTPEVFETGVGNIPPQKTVKVEIQYISELKADLSGDGVLVTIPTSVAPRYGAPPAAASGSTVTPVENGLKIQVEVSSSVPIRKLESRTHPISVELGGESNPDTVDSFAALAATSTFGPASTEFNPRKARATLSDRSTSLGRDFVLLILASDRNILASRAILERHHSLSPLSALQISFSPGQLFSPETSMKNVKSEIVFVADRSGSMLSKMTVLQSALRIFIKSIPQNCLFNIHSFGSNHSTLWAESRPYIQENVDLAMGHVTNQFASDMGGTEILSALQNAVNVRTKREDLSTEIILLTDGEVWDTENTIRFVKNARKESKDKVRFFALGIGDAVSHRLIEGIGRQGGGFAQVVAVDSTGKWEIEIIRMLKGALTPSQWQCEIILPETRSATPATSNQNFLPNQLPIPRPMAIKAPYFIPSIHAFVRTSVYFFLDPNLLAGKSTITVQGTASSGEKFETEIPLGETTTKSPTIHFLAAKALMNDLESGQSWMHAEEHRAYRSRDSEAFERTVRIEAEQIGMHWSISGKWTSFVAVDNINQTEQKSRIYLAERSELADLTRSRSVPYQYNYNVPPRSRSSFGNSSTLIKYGHITRDTWHGSRASLMRESSVLSDAWHVKSSYHEVKSGCTESSKALRNIPMAVGQTTSPLSRASTKISLLTLDEIINFQTIQGDFTLPDNLVLTLPGIQAKNEVVEKIARTLRGDPLERSVLINIYITLLVVNYIKTAFPNSNEMWSLIVQKAYSWVESSLKGELNLQQKIDDGIRANMTELH